MKILLIPLLFLGCQIDTQAQSDSMLLVKSDTNVIENFNEFYGFGNCYFSDKSFRKNGDVKKEVRSNSGGNKLIIRYCRNKTKTKRKYNSKWIRNQRPPCH